jgi:hypothetical protein
LEDTTIKQELAATVGGMLERRHRGVRACGGNVIASIWVTILTMKNIHK